MIVGISGKKCSGKDTIASIMQYLIDANEREQALIKYPDELPIYTFEEWMELQNTGIEVYGTTFADYFSRWDRKAFSRKLKKIVHLLTGVNAGSLDKEEIKSQLLPLLWKTSKGLVPTYRQFLQRLGKDCIRDMIHPDAWIIALFIDYVPTSSYTETRFNATQAKDGKYLIPRIPEIPKQHWDKESTPTFVHKQKILVYPKWIITDVRFPNEAKAIKDRKGILLRVTRDGLEQDSHPSETSLDDYTEFDYIIPNNGTFLELIEKVKIILEHFEIIKTDE